MYRSLLLGFCLFSCIHSQTPANFEQRTSSEVVHNVTIAQNKATTLVRIPLLFASNGMPAWSMCLLATTRWSGIAQYKKRDGKIGPSGIFKCKTKRSFFFFQFHITQRSQIHFLLHWNCQQVLSPNTPGNIKTSGL